MFGSNRYFRLLISIAVALVLAVGGFIIEPPQEVLATAITSARDGDWSNGGTWTDGVVPAEGDTVILNHNVVIDPQQSSFHFLPALTSCFFLLLLESMRDLVGGDISASS